MNDKVTPNNHNISNNKNLTNTSTPTITNIYNTPDPKKNSNDPQFWEIYEGELGNNNDDNNNKHIHIESSLSNHKKVNLIEF